MNFLDFLNADLSDDESEEEETFEKIEFTKYILHDTASKGDTDRLKKIIYQYEHRDYNPKDPELSINKKDCNGCTPLHLALLNQCNETAKYIIENGGKIDDTLEGNSLYHIVLLTSLQNETDGYLEDIIPYLYSKNLSINSTDYLKQTPIHFCAIYDHIYALNIISLLNPLYDLLDINGNTPLIIAAINNSIKVAGLLLNQESVKKNINLKNNEGYNALHYCCIYDYQEMFKLLRDNGGDIEIKDKYGNNCLQLSLLCKNYSITRLIDESSVIEPPKLSLKKKMLIITNTKSLNHITYDENDDKISPPQERLQRIKSLIDPTYNSILVINKRYNNNNNIIYSNRFGTISDILRVHDYFYINRVREACKCAKDKCYNFDGDTTVSKGSYDAAMSAVGTICEAIDEVINNQCKNAFCIIRPPGHHVGINGIYINIIK